jgi:hypothetical protein
MQVKTAELVGDSKLQLEKFFNVYSFNYIVVKKLLEESK